MGFYRLWFFVCRCDATGCDADLLVESTGAEKPTPAAWSRQVAQRNGWEFASRGNRLGWRAYCPEHKPDH